ncbi:hypothetical protein [Pelomonas cellulosilytica]|uniref:Uncharacterized protein n=1 Tax=Pelomonas cellulosilytica TaxID=2906762 RepID=A0ABS8XU93_9BURK|nr:hypothetical protein [Pelomonas sp. P8]MCE4554875.1 hypothetical protein [Pelomonas sp. P8]
MTKQFLFSLTLVQAAFLCSSATACESSEKVIFECQSKTHRVTFCETGSAKSQSWIVKYRYERIGGNIELAYPANATTRAHDAFTYNHDTWSKGERSVVSFVNGGYRYFVHHASTAGVEDETPNEAGVRVFKNGALVADIKCDLPTVKDNMFKAFNQAGLKQYEEK